jgi:tyrosine-protein kinase Etk/Wzc
MANSEFEFFDEGEAKSGAPSVDPKLIFFKVISKWPIFLISIGIGLLVVFIFHRYATEKYRLRSTILIPERSTNIDQSIIDQFGFDFSTNFLNEIERLKSDEITAEALKELPFWIEYYSKGRVKTILEYNTLPFEIKLDTAQPVPFEKEFKISFVENNQFRLTLAEDEDHEEAVVHKPYEQISIDGLSYTLVFNRSASLTGKEYYFIVRNPNRLVNEWNGKLKVTYLREFTSIAELTIESRDARKGADFLNKVMQVYQYKELERKNISADRSIQYIDREMQSLEDTLSIYASQLDQKKVDNRVIDFNQVGSDILERRTSLEVEEGIFNEENQEFK